MTLSYLCDGSALTHNVAPTTVSVTSAAEMGEAAQSGLVIEDPGADLVLLGHRPFVITEDACAQPRLFTGWTTERGIGRDVEAGLFVGSGARSHDVTIIDLNALFNFRLISGTDGNRPAETWNARMAWLLASDYLSGLIADTGRIVANGATMDEADYRGQYPAAVLSDLVERFAVREMTYFAFWDTTASAVGLWLDELDAAISDSTLRISNVPADIDSTTTFAPDPEAKLGVTPTETYSEVLIDYDRGTKRLFRSRASTAAKYIRRGTTMSRPYTRHAADASDQANSYLDNHANERDRITVTIIVPASCAGLATAGQRMDVKFSHLTGYTTFTSMRVVRCTLAPTNDLATHYSMALELLAPRPVESPSTECSGGAYDLTPSGYYPPLNQDDNDGSIVYYLRAGVVWPIVPTPGAEGGLIFRTLGAAGSPDMGEAPYWANEHVRFIVVGAGTLVVSPYSSGALSNCTLKLYHDLAGTPVLDGTVAGTTAADLTIDVLTHSGAYCVHWVQLEYPATEPSTLDFGFAGATWTAGAPSDAEIELPPPPGVPITSTSDPTVNDDIGDGYNPGQTWVNTTTPEAFVLVDNTLGAAVWVSTTTAAGDYVSIRDGGKETVSTVAASGATETLDLANGNVHDVTLTADCTLTFAGATVGVACSFTLLLRQDGTGGWTTTWPGSVVWAGGTAPTLDETASTVAVLTFFSLDGGTVWYGFPTGGGSAVAALDDLTDVTITAAAADDTLRYVEAEWVNDNRRWEPVTTNLHMTETFPSTGPELVWDGDDIVMTWRAY